MSSFDEEWIKMFKKRQHLPEGKTWFSKHDYAEFCLFKGTQLAWVKKNDKHKVALFKGVSPDVEFHVCHRDTISEYIGLRNAPNSIPKESSKLLKLLDSVCNDDRIIGVRFSDTAEPVAEELAEQLVAFLKWPVHGYAREVTRKRARPNHQEAAVDVNVDIPAGVTTRYQQRANLGSQEPKPRHVIAVPRKRTPKPAKLFSLQYLKYWSTDTYDWYRCWCLESPNDPYFQHHRNLVQDYPGCEDELKAIKQKGYKAKRSKWLGCGSSEEAVSPVPSGLDQKAAVTVEGVGPLLPVRWQSSNTHCVPFAFLNVIDASHRTKKTLFRLFPGRNCGLNDLAPIVRNKPFKRQLRHCSITIPGILTNKTELFLVVDGVHCVGVDCSRQLIFDCAKTTALPLSEESFRKCHVLKIDEARQITTFACQ